MQTTIPSTAHSTMQSTTVPVGFGAAGRRELAYWSGRGPVRTPRGLVPVTITGPERYVPGARGNALLVERATTNLVSNPRGGGGSGAPWLLDGTGATLTAISDPTAPHGTALRLAGHSGTIARAYESIEAAAPSLTQGTPFAVRFLARALNATAEGAPLHARLWEIGGASGAAVTASVTSVFTDEWVSHEFIGEIQATGRTELQILLGAPYGGAAVGAEYGLTDIKVEPAPESTSYLDGDLGTGFAWTAAAHASPSTRLATSAQTGGLLGSTGCVVLRCRPSWASVSLGHRTLFESGTLRLGFDGEGHWTLEDGSVTTQVDAAHVAGDDLVLFAGWDPRSLRLALNIGAEETAIRSERVGPAEWRVGSGEGGSEEVDGAVGPLTWLNAWPTFPDRVRLVRG